MNRVKNKTLKAMNYICPKTLQPCYSSGCYFERGYQICSQRETFASGDVSLPKEKTEPKEQEVKEETIVDAMFRAQFGTPHQSTFIEDHIKEYFTRWPNYKDRLNHLEWYHLFLDFHDKVESENEALRQSLKELIPIAEKSSITVDNSNWREEWERKRQAIERAKQKIKT